MKAELLAPAGGKPHLIAAVNAGADAVYMGGMSFNARAFAENFSDEELPESIKYAHAHGVKVYMTMNTLIKDEELAEAFEYCNYVYGLGIDGLIVQDLGLIRLLHKYLPDLPLHLSTQATIYNKEALDAAEQLGISRVVPARELSIYEIRELTEAASKMDPAIDIEVFVHGALCMCYSGQCQMSRVLGQGSGRTGNRGTCAQPCRQGYMDEAGRSYHALSPKDICLIDNIPELTQASVSSFKIEGRIKSPEYVAAVTSVYRKYIDLYDRLERECGPDEAASKYEIDPEDMMMLRQVFNRGDFTTGYLHGNPGSELLSGRSPKNSGLYVGKVAAVIDSEDKLSEKDEKTAARGALRRGKVIVCIKMADSSSGKGMSISNGDGIEFASDDTDYIASGPAGGVTTYIKDIGDGYYLIGDYDKGMRAGDSVYKIRDSRLTEQLLDMPEKKIQLTMQFTAREGQYPSLIANDVGINHSVEIISDSKTEAARKTATEASMIEDCLSKLGGTSYTAGMTGIDVQMDDNLMVSLSAVNRMRREAVDELIRYRTMQVIDSRGPKLSRESLDEIRDREHLGSLRLEASEYPALIKGRKVHPVPIEEFMDMKCDAQNDSIPYILNVSKGRLDEYLRDNFSKICDAVRDSGILIGNLGWIGRFIEAGIRVYADYGLNVYNDQARLAVSELGAELYLPSHETGISDERGIALMITEHPVDAKTLTDRKGEAHLVVRSASGDKTLIY